MIHLDDLGALLSGVRSRELRVYEDEAEEFDAVCEGRKAIVMFSFLDSSEAQMDEMRGVIEDARREGLVVETIEVSADLPKEYASTSVLICRPEEVWRVPAMRELYAVMGYYPWSLALEALMSSFLGYSRVQVAAWIADARDQYAGWNGDTVYVAMTMDQAEQVVACGSRYLPREALDLGAMQCFVGRGSARIGKAGYPLVLDGISIARVLLSRGYAHPSVVSLRRAPGEGCVGFVVDETNVRRLNGNMLTTIEFLTADGWVLKKQT